MSQVYSNPEREPDPYSLPDCEVFYVSAEDFLTAQEETWMYDTLQEFRSCYNTEEEEALALSGFYYWYCLPGCLPDSDPRGPFMTKEEAIEQIREYAEEDNAIMDDDTQ